MRTRFREGVGHAELADARMIRREGGVAGDGRRDRDRLSLLRFRTKQKRKKTRDLKRQYRKSLISMEASTTD